MNRRFTTLGSALVLALSMTAFAGTAGAGNPHQPPAGVPGNSGTAPGQSKQAPPTAQAAPTAQTATTAQSQPATPAAAPTASRAPGQ